MQETPNSHIIHNTFSVVVVVIIKYTDDYITTYGGPFQGVQTIKTQDFQPYIRVMPHAEFPSGSGCICKALADFIDGYVQQQHGVSTLPFMFEFTRLIAEFPGRGPSKYEPGGPQEQIQFDLPDMNSMYENCRQSRLWGGMHFTESIEATDILCADIGQDVNNLLNNLRDVNPDRRRLNIDDEQQALNITQAKIEWNILRQMRERQEDALHAYNYNEENIENMPQEYTNDNVDDSNNKLYIGILMGFGLGFLLCTLVGVVIYLYRVEKKSNSKEQQQQEEKVEVRQTHYEGA